MITRIRARLISTILPGLCPVVVLGLAPLPAVAADIDGIAPDTVLQGNVEIRLDDNRIYTGELAGLSAGRLAVIVFDGTGEVEYSLPVAEIDTVRFPGNDVHRIGLELYHDRQYNDAVPLLEAVFRHRAEYLPLLDASTTEAVAALPRAYLETGRAIDAVGTALRLLRQTDQPEYRYKLETVVLNGFIDLGLYDRAAEEARAWCAREGPYPESALGWSVLAEIELRDENYHEALWISLQPIAFSTARPMDHLERAYAVAIHASHALGEEEKGWRLFREMTDRHLGWPEDRTEYNETHAFYSRMQKALEEAEGSSGDVLEIDPRPAREDLNLPLREVRKLLLALPDD